MGDKQTAAPHDVGGGRCVKGGGGRRRAPLTDAVGAVTRSQSCVLHTPPCPLHAHYAPGRRGLGDILCRASLERGAPEEKGDAEPQRDDGAHPHKSGSGSALPGPLFARNQQQCVPRSVVGWGRLSLWLCSLCRAAPSGWGRPSPAGTHSSPCRAAAAHHPVARLSAGRVQEGAPAALLVPCSARCGRCVTFLASLSPPTPPSCLRVLRRLVRPPLCPRPACLPPYPQWRKKRMRRLKRKRRKMRQRSK